MPFWNTKGGNAFALAHQVSPEFSQDSRIRLLAALQMVYRSLLTRGLVLSLSVNDLRLLCDAFKNTDHLVVSDCIAFVITLIPRLESAGVVEVKQFGTVCLAFYKNEFAADKSLCFP